MIFFTKGGDFLSRYLTTVIAKQENKQLTKSISLYDKPYPLDRPAPQKTETVNLCSGGKNAD